MPKYVPTLYVYLQSNRHIYVIIVEREKRLVEDFLFNAMYGLIMICIPIGIRKYIYLSN